jgi:co-chaperonin GroES (HSP10)
MDAGKFKPYGPWVLIEPESPERQYKGLIYLPEGNLEEKLGYASGYVIAVGNGFFNRKKNAKTKFIPMDIEVGQRVVYRGHLKDANIVGRSCLIHAQDIIGELVDGRLNAARAHGD